MSHVFNLFLLFFFRKILGSITMTLTLFSFLLQKDLSFCLAFFCPFLLSSSKTSWDISRVSLRSISLLFWWYLLTNFIKKFLLVIYHFYHIYHIYKKKLWKYFLPASKTNFKMGVTYVMWIIWIIFHKFLKKLFKFFETFPWI